ncbi:uncharacterized protein AMSG_01561 [Thecamonas trahens ATCC 50062]|uniref:Small ribosomal subunit protein mS35 mitochondrial conserved domain-containing protein n=1 Tax=Thecamonas trahens ATCC 50062 TaxID=461836 RepID=A0A0L0DRR7_THETB|nr:hypothetical protein AMSG_01561 [Thecamonas trahens ATCC 50062]KNC54711.1 hypothetical protein AMSG_01561 [Thecamonas trahens ATCC 50062]|eukprot:XP_013761611.1 hypothetical protein AMSG_01561 [Thecamonas trahens ATCC 50062]
MLRCVGGAGQRLRALSATWGAQAPGRWASSESAADAGDGQSKAGEEAGEAGMTPFGVRKVDDGLYEMDEEAFHELLHSPTGEFSLVASSIGGGAPGKGGDDDATASDVAAFVARVHEEYAKHAAEHGSNATAAAESRAVEITSRETLGPGPDGLFGGSARGDAKVVLKARPAADWGLDKTQVYELGVIAGPRYAATKDILTLTVDEHLSVAANRAVALEQLDAIYGAVKLDDSESIAAAITAAASDFELADSPDFGVKDVSNVEDRAEWVAK